MFGTSAFPLLLMREFVKAAAASASVDDKASRLQTGNVALGSLGSHSPVSSDIGCKDFLPLQQGIDEPELADVARAGVNSIRDIIRDIFS